MSEVLATSPGRPGEAPTVEGRLADIIERADVQIDEYRLSASDRAKVVAALRRAVPAEVGTELENARAVLAGIKNSLCGYAGQFIGKGSLDQDAKEILAVAGQVNVAIEHLGKAYDAALSLCTTGGPAESGGS